VSSPATSPAPPPRSSWALADRHDGGVRPGTTIVLAVLLALILGASAIQLVLFAR
jgi:hypothetical protein